MKGERFGLTKQDKNFPGQMLHGQMSPEGLFPVKDGHRNLPSKSGK